MKLQTVSKSLPCWVQVGLLVIGMAGSILLEYIQLERERNAKRDEDSDEERASNKEFSNATKRRPKQNRASRFNRKED